MSTVDGVETALTEFSIDQSNLTSFSASPTGKYTAAVLGDPVESTFWGFWIGERTGDLMVTRHVTDTTATPGVLSQPPAATPYMTVSPVQFLSDDLFLVHINYKTASLVYIDDFLLGSIAGDGTVTMATGVELFNPPLSSQESALYGTAWFEGGTVTIVAGVGAAGDTTLQLNRLTFQVDGGSISGITRTPLTGIPTQTCVYIEPINATAVMTRTYSLNIVSDVSGVGSVLCQFSHKALVDWSTDNYKYNVLGGFVAIGDVVWYPVYRLNATTTSFVLASVNWRTGVPGTPLVLATEPDVLYGSGWIPKIARTAPGHLFALWIIEDVFEGSYAERVYGMDVDLTGASPTFVQTLIKSADWDVNFEDSKNLDVPVRNVPAYGMLEVEDNSSGTNRYFWYGEAPVELPPPVLRDVRRAFIG